MFLLNLQCAATRITQLGKRVSETKMFKMQVEGLLTSISSYLTKLITNATIHFSLSHDWYHFDGHMIAAYQ